MAGGKSICLHMLQPRSRRRFYSPRIILRDELYEVQYLSLIHILKDQEVAMAAAEICAAIEQFGGMLSGSIGFFDSEVRRVVPITSAENLLQLKPYSGGGTSFQCIFDYVREHMSDNVPSEIVIMTDGKSDFPEYEASSGIPVLWLLTNNRVRIPWGQAAYFRK